MNSIYGFLLGCAVSTMAREGGGDNRGRDMGEGVELEGEALVGPEGRH